MPIFTGRLHEFDLVDIDHKFPSRAGAKFLLNSPERALYRPPQHLLPPQLLEYIEAKTWRLAMGLITTTYCLIVPKCCRLLKTIPISVEIDQVVVETTGNCVRNNIRRVEPAHLFANRIKATRISVWNDVQGYSNGGTTSG